MSFPRSRSVKGALLLGAVLLVSCFAAAQTAQMIGINIVLKQSPTNAILTDLAKYGAVRDVVPEINAVTLQAKSSQLSTIQSLPYVAAANADQKRTTGPEPSSAADATADAGLSTWDLDSINVTSAPGASNRAVAQDGAGVYVAVVDTGLINNWTYYFPAGRIATQYARAFSGGGGDQGTVSTTPNVWGQDQNSHGTHVTSTILGYRLGNQYVNGVAPAATVIPVKVLNQTERGWGWSSVIARGIVYVADLKANQLAASPVVINMSLGGPQADAMEHAAVQYAISKGVVVVAAAGNEGNAGMGYPGAFPEVISVAATGWTGEWTAPSWWRTVDVPETATAADFYITDFSSREKAGQQLDVAAPGSWVVGPYQTNGQISYYYLGGTSMASPHVAGTAALMLQKNPTLTASQIESILKSTALAMPAGCRAVKSISGAIQQICWGNDASGSGLVQVDKALAAF